ncbi:hypothetical protein B2J88_48225 [Rhodococcus sp. SRB_17]|nr:hypothetical protein [Rhodococcus sp. SRB_17]
MVKATCFGKYPDLSIKVEGPDDAVLLAKAGDTTMNVKFAEMGPVDITPPASQYKWGPTGVELSVDMGTGSKDKEKRLPEVFGTMTQAWRCGCSSRAPDG